ncbi:MAG TPA: methylmalonyl-CoA decarboxylase [Candidatus Binatia bacterium]
MDLILVRIEEGIGTITLNNPARRNCICAKLVDELVAAFESLEKDGARVIVLRGLAGTRVWSAGHDIEELPRHGRDPLDYEGPLENLLRKVQMLLTPVIALVEGSVWGGACDLLASCDITICTEDATFAITPAKLGLPYNPSGLIHFIHGIGPHMAKEMLFTARPITAADALGVRMVNHVMPTLAEAEAKAYDIARAVADNAPLAVGVMKRQFRMLLAATVLPVEILEMIQGLRRTVYESDDYLEGIAAFKEKRKPAFTGR